MKKMLTTLLASFLLFVPGTVIADSPHFTSASASSGGQDEPIPVVSVQAHEAGLGGDAAVEIVVAASVHVVYRCRKHGRRQIIDSITDVSAFFYPVEGNVMASFNLALPPTTLVCRKHKHLRLHRADWGPITVADFTNGLLIEAERDF